MTEINIETVSSDDTESVDPSASENPFTNLKSSFIENLEDKDFAKPIQDFKDFDALANSYIHAQKALGGKISIPKEEDDEGWDKLYSKLGAFDSPDKYSLDNDKFEFDKDLSPHLQALLHQGKLTDKQAKVVVNGLAAISSDIELKQAEAYEAKVNVVKESYGEEYPVVEAKIKDLAQRNGIDQDVILSQIKDKPELIALLTKAYDTKKEINPDPSTVSTLSPEQEIANLFKDQSIKQAWFRDAGRSLPEDTRNKIRTLMQTARL